MGLVTRAVPVDHPDFGRAFECPACNGGPAIQAAKARNQARVLALLDDAGIEQTPRHDWLEWGHFSAEYLGADAFAGKEIAVMLARAFGSGQVLSYDMLGEDHPFAQQYPTATRFRPTPNLFLYGAVGTGKTALAALAYKTRLNAGGVGVSVEWSQLYSAIRGTYGDRSNTSYQILQAVANAPILLLDDLGHEGRGFTDDQFRVAWEIINGRYSNMKPTIITSNLDRHALGDALTHKVSGRIAEAWVMVEMGGMGLREFDVAGGD